MEIDSYHRSPLCISVTSQAPAYALEHAYSQKAETVSATASILFLFLVVEYPISGKCLIRTFPCPEIPSSAAGAGVLDGKNKLLPADIR
jgi:hypothetical protein